MLLPKIKEFTKEELLKQFEMSEIDIDFLCEYIAKRDKVYNRLIDELNFKNSGFREIKEFVYKNSIPKYLLSNPPKETLDFEGDITDILKIIDKYMKED